jgi:hypothetical protein
MNLNNKSFIRINAHSPDRYKSVIIEKEPELVLKNLYNNNYSFANVENSDNIFYFFTGESYGLSLLCEYAYVYGLIKSKKFSSEKKLVAHLLEKKNASESEMQFENFNKNLMNRVSKIESNYNDDIKAFQQNIVEKVLSTNDDFSFFNIVLNQKINESVVYQNRTNGPKGPNGPNGPKGPNGLNGPKGPNGPNGPRIIFEILSKYLVLCSYYLGSSQFSKFVDTFKVLDEKNKDFDRSNSAMKNDDANYVSSSTFIILKQKKEISESIDFIKKNMNVMNSDLENKNKLLSNIENLQQRKKKYQDFRSSKENLEKEISNMNKQVSELQEKIKLKENIERKLTEKKNELKYIQNLKWTNNNDAKLSEYQSKYDKIDNYQKYKNYLRNKKNITS